MRPVLAVSAVVLALAGEAAVAQSRPSTLNMSCHEAQALVGSRGGIVLSTGRHTYDRYVASGRFCAFGEWAYPRTVPTADAPQCPIGYVCETREPWWLEDEPFIFLR